MFLNKNFAWITTKFWKIFRFLKIRFIVEKWKNGKNISRFPQHLRIRSPNLKTDWFLQIFPIHIDDFDCRCSSRLRKNQNHFSFRLILVWILFQPRQLPHSNHTDNVCTLISSKHKNSLASSNSSLGAPDLRAAVFIPLCWFYLCCSF